MSLKRDVTYPGRFSTADTDHPMGAFKNRTSPDSEDGSYLEATWANDLSGFLERILTAAGVAPNGTADTATSSQVYDALMSLVLQNGNNLSEILSKGSAAQASAQKNLGIADSDGYVGKLLAVRVFSASTSYTPTTGTKKLRVTLVGGGGAGGGTPAVNGSNSSAAGGGGSGAQISAIVTVNFTSLQITIGAGGSPTLGGKGGDGGTTSFGSLLSVAGGLGAVAAGTIDTVYFYSPGSGGSSYTGNASYFIRGNAGLIGQTFNPITCLGGQGASCAFGSGGNPAGVTLGGNYVYGNQASGFGGGGSGGAATGTSPATSGGNGSSGVCIIEEFA